MSIIDVVTLFVILIMIFVFIYIRDIKTKAPACPTQIVDPEKYDSYGVSFFVISQVIYQRRVVAICKINIFYFVLYASGMHTNRERQSITSMVSLDDAMKCYANAIQCITRPDFEEVYFNKEKPCE